MRPLDGIKIFEMAGRSHRSTVECYWQILAEFGYSEGEIEDLFEKEIVQ